MYLEVSNLKKSYGEGGSFTEVLKGVCRILKSGGGKERGCFYREDGAYDSNGNRCLRVAFLSSHVPDAESDDRPLRRIYFHDENFRIS